jgi:methylase of polypeptide subunit release factors
VEVAWSEARYPRVWCPTIDTILLARAARQHLDGRRRRGRALPGSFLEIGCGSGFVAKYVLQKAAEAGSPVKRAHLMDISRDALSCAMAAIEPVQGRTLVSYSLNLAGEPIAAADRYDLLVCNPPYVPRPRARVTTPTARARREPRALVGVEEPNRNPFEGLFLYGEIQRLASVLMDESSRLLLILSSLSREDVVREMARVFTIRTLRALDVPLKIPVVTARASRESRAWMDWLERTKRLTVDETEASGYRYWQRIEVAELALR